MPDLEDKVRRSKRIKANGIHKQWTVVPRKYAGELPPKRFQLTKRRPHYLPEWKHDTSPSGYALVKNGMAECTDISLGVGFFFGLYKMAAQLPESAIELLVDFQVLEIQNPSAAKTFNKRHGGTRLRGMWVSDVNHGYMQRYRYEWQQIEFKKSYHPARYGIPQSMARATFDKGFPMSAEQCSQLYEVCIDDNAALEALQNHDIVRDAVTRVHRDRAAMQFDLDGEDQRAYETLYNNPANRSYDRKILLPKSERKAKRR